MSICMLILVIIQDQYSYDNFINNKKDLYRIQSEDNLSKYALNKFASTTFPLAKEIRDNYPFADKITAVNNSFSGEAKYNDIVLSISGLYAQDNFFDIFNFNLIRGSSLKALEEPFSIIMKEDVAKKFFGDEDPMGKSIFIENYGNLKVTGIIENSRQKTHVQFESLVSSSTLAVLAQQDADRIDQSTNWSNYYSSYIYILPYKNSDMAAIQTALDDISTKRYGDNEKIDLTFYLYPFDKIVPGPILGNELGMAMPRIYLIFFAALAIVIIISAAFNYTSLSIARSLTRAREFGVRKTVGATRREVIYQIFIEAILISMLSLFFAIGILQLILPVFKGFKMMALLQVDPDQNIIVYIWFIAFALTTGILAGGLPAIYISKINPVVVLKGAGNIKLLKRLTFRKILLVVQYFFSIVFIISIILIYRQMLYMVNAEMGFDRELVYNIRLNGKGPDLVKDRFSRLTDVTDVSAGSHIPGIGNIRDTDVKLKEEDEAINSHYFAVDENYIKTMGLNLVAGENFPENISMDSESLVIISQLAVEKYNLGSPIDAIGKNLIIDDTINMQVIGVVENYKYCALFLPFRPLLLRNKPDEFRYAVLRLQTNNLAATIEKFEEEWKSIDPTHELEGEFMDTEIREFYTYFEDILYMVGYTTILAIIIASLGLFGMAAYSIQTRTKEDKMD